MTVPDKRRLEGPRAGAAAETPARRWRKVPMTFTLTLATTLAATMAMTPVMAADTEPA